MPYFEFYWTDETVEHLAEHGVSPDDFEHVVQHPEQRDVSRSSGLPAAFGYTSDGRFIIAVYEHLDELLIRPVTAYPIDE